VPSESARGIQTHTTSCPLTRITNSSNRLIHQTSQGIKSVKHQAPSSGSLDRSISRRNIITYTTRRKNSGKPHSPTDRKGDHSKSGRKESPSSQRRDRGELQTQTTHTRTARNPAKLDTQRESTHH
jgi:hypothetical protein